MHSCFVSIPFGVRTGIDGRALDFDYLYRMVIRPAVEEVGVECRRLDELSPGAIWHKSLFTALVTSDLYIADISTANANVFYELGIRHALKRGRTILISAGGRIPGNLSYVQALWYEPDVEGQLKGEAASQFRTALQSIIRQSQRSSISDSPIYEFFPDLEVVLPSELDTSSRPRRSPPTKLRSVFVQSAVESPARAKGELDKREAEVRGSVESDPTAYLTLLRKYRDLSEWDRVVELAESAPEPLSQSPELRQMLALSLNRRGQTGDREKAIALMEQQIAETGGDSESFGILGRIYKDRYDEAKGSGDAAKAALDHQHALESYRKGFEKNPRDYYPGINVVTLLLQAGDDASRAELATIVPRVREAVQQRLEGDRPDFWDIATDLQLSTVARDWTHAEMAARQVVAQAPNRWMLDSTVRDVRVVRSAFSDPHDRKKIDHLLDLLQPRGTAEESAL
jgi:tetratricopeptide (TPR) repeat protein